MEQIAKNHATIYESETGGTACNNNLEVVEQILAFCTKKRLFQRFIFLK
jgi:hypothetical protein